MTPHHPEPSTASWDDGMISRLRAGAESSARAEAAQTQPPAAAPLETATGPEPDAAPRPREGRDDPAYRRLSRRQGSPPWVRGWRAMRSLVVSDEAPDWFTRSSAAVQTPLALPRRVAVLGARGGAGTTAVAVMMARALSFLRHDRTLLVAATADLGSLALRADVPRARSVAAAAAVLAGEPGLTPERLPDLAEDAGSDLWVVPTGGDDVSVLADAVSRMGRLCPVAVVDAGRSLDVVRAADLHALVVVAPATIDGIVSVEQVLDALRGDLDPATGRVHVVLDTLPGARRAARRLERRLRDRGHPTYRLPTDQHLAAGARVDLDRLAEPTQLALMDLLAGVVLSTVDGPGGGQGGPR